jgi:hypothetical protein
MHEGSAGPMTKLGENANDRRQLPVKQALARGRLIFSYVESFEISPAVRDSSLSIGHNRLRMFERAMYDVYAASTATFNSSYRRALSSYK